MRTTLDIDADLLKRLRLEAHRRGVPLKHLLNMALRRGLAEPSETRRRSRYRCPTLSLGPPRPGLNLDKALALAAAQAIRILDRWVQLEPVVLLHTSDDHWRIMKGLLERAGTAGNHTTDAHLAALAIEQDSELCSTDRDFGAFPDLRWINPLGSPS